ncbi:MAG: hypothetical protein RBR24_09585, partial [Candidatus Carbobacillus sp.]|nr:hypothetical protein [Candidatus Carbobacillus sp.]
MNTSRLYDNDQNGFALPLVFLILFLMSLMMIVVFRMTQTSFTLTVKTEKLHAAQHHALDGLIYFEDQLLRALSNSHTTLPSDADADDIKNALTTLIDAIIAPDHLPAGAPFTFQPPQWQASQEGRSILMTLTSEGIDAHPSERRLTRTYLFSLATRPLFYTIAASGLTIKNDVVIDGQVYVGPLGANDQNTGTIQIAYTNDQKPSIYGTLTTTLSSFQLSPPVRPPLNQACRINPNTYALREDCLSLAFDTPPSLQKKHISFDRIPIEDNVLRAYLNKNSLNTEPLCEYDKNGNCKRLLDIHLLRSEQAAYSHGLRVQNVRLSSGTMLTVDGDLI